VQPAWIEVGALDADGNACGPSTKASSCSPTCCPMGNFKQGSADYIACYNKCTRRSWNMWLEVGAKTDNAASPPLEPHAGKHEGEDASVQPGWIEVGAVDGDGNACGPGTKPSGCSRLCCPLGNFARGSKAASTCAINCQVNLVEVGAKTELATEVGNDDSEDAGSLIKPHAGR